MKTSVAVLLLALVTLPGCQTAVGPVSSTVGARQPALGTYQRHDLGYWNRGHWWRGSHGNRSGWWYVVGDDWHPFEKPTHDIYAPLGEEAGWWYWCTMYMDYYPNVSLCPGGWQRLAPN